MISPLVSLVLAVLQAPPSPLPTGLRTALERQLPAWAQITANAAPPSDSIEPIALSLSDSGAKVVLLDRHVQLVLRREASRYWISQASWCSEALWKARCEPFAVEPGKALPPGYELRRDSLATASTSWEDAVPSLEPGRAPWTAGGCRDGVCFATSDLDSGLVRFSIRPDGSVVEKGDPFDPALFGKKARLKVAKYLKRVGRTVPYRSASKFGGVAAWYDPRDRAGQAPAAIAVPTPEPVATALTNSCLADSLETLLAAIEAAPAQAKAKPLSASKVEALSKRIVSGKAVAQRAAGTDECSGTDRLLRRFADGSHALLQGKRVVALQLQDSSLKAYALGSSMTANDVVKSLGIPSRRDVTFFVYETGALDPNEAEVDQVHWKILVQFRDGLVFRAIFLRLFDDC